MILSLMQPYFMPYLSYFSLIKHTDLFVLFDTIQYMKGGWIPRNRILRPDGTVQFLTIPIKKHHVKTPICQVQINERTDWRQTLVNQLEHYKKYAPYYSDVIRLVKDCLDIATDNIALLNQHAIQGVCDFLGIKTPIKVYSEVSRGGYPVNDSDEWSLNLCLELGAEEYWNPIGGMTFYSREKYAEKGVRLLFHNAILTPYKQRKDMENCELGLSILDVLMFNHPDEINAMLDNYELL